MGFPILVRQHLYIESGPSLSYIVNIMTTGDLSTVPVRAFTVMALTSFTQNIPDSSSEWLTLLDDVIKWKHFPCYWPFVRGIHRSPVNSPNKGQWRGDLKFSLICVWINFWVNNHEAGDLRRHRAHHSVIVMHTVQGLDYLEANWVNVMAADALDPCIARSSTAMILIIQMRILMPSLRVNLNNLSLSSVWSQLTHCCLTDVVVILNIKLSNMFLWMISLVFPLNFAIRWMPLDLIDDK